METPLYVDLLNGSCVTHCYLSSTVIIVSLKTRYFYNCDFFYCFIYFQTHADHSMMIFALLGLMCACLLWPTLLLLDYLNLEPLEGITGPEVSFHCKNFNNVKHCAIYC